MAKTSAGKTPSKSGAASRSGAAARLSSSGASPRPATEGNGNGHAPPAAPLPPTIVIPPGASLAASRTVNPVATIALETSARVKRQRVLDIVLPQSTSARMAEAARASVWAISSEKTTTQYQAAEEAAESAEEARSETLVEAAATSEAIPDELRRSSKDLFAFLRRELEREDDPDDPHTLWRRAHKRMRHELFAGPPMAELTGLEERLGVRLPPSYWDFSLEWGGGHLFVHEYSSIRVVPALEIKSEVAGALCGRMRRPWLPVVDLGCLDYLALDMSTESRNGEHPLHWWYCGEPKKKVAESFAAWLERLVAEDGQPYWWA